MQQKYTIRELQAKETKEKIFKVTIKLLSERDFNNVTIDDICNLAGVAKGSFYRYFKSKGDLLSVWYQQMDLKYMDIYNQLDHNLCATEKLYAFANEVCALLANEVGFMVIKNVYTAQLIDVQFTYVFYPKRSFYTVLTEIISEGQKKGEFCKDIDSKEIGDILIYMFRGLHYSWSTYCSKDLPYDLYSETQKCLDLIILSIKMQRSELHCKRILKQDRDE